ncbi:SHOCT domain-containing protein [Actinomadura spongiicola]|uniref:SHOCT domain-containing protein n=2 Tax=Actinomadura spongiicola TaxID=2303421 RepID=A0A372GBW9_9ACTN|nr:SHOCT domain-containing protein [Actinomadura spongiicola]
MSNTHTDRFLISVPNPIVRLVGFDGAVDLRGDVLRFTWGLEANPRKRMRLHRSTLAINNIQSTTWMDWRNDPDKIGYLRFQPVGTQRLKHQTVDATTVLLETDEQFAEAIVFAATVLERKQLKKVLPPSAKKTDNALASPPDAAELLRKLGELRDAGILTDDEFQAKKKEILDRL